KYFGATGWRLAVIAAAADNIFDKLISQLPADEKKDLNRRYSTLSLNPAKIKFIDRLVADSRMVALNHTAGLSTPQQIQMALFAGMSLADTEDAYKKRMHEIIQERLHTLWDKTGFTLLPDPLRAGYYSEIDVMVWARKFYGDDFANYLNKNYEPLDFVVRLANETSVVLLNGDGFDGPKWSVRASLANLDKEAYAKIGTAIRLILDSYHEKFLKETGA
ncbi:MAG: aspartate 4-decarboxylase, partial [Muribaculaceae bacterium]|nr:aspartate 4-decarboxylase [Muribaculaceae bacterium]